MPRIIQLILFFLISTGACAQYTYTGRHYADSLPISAEETPYDKTSFKNYNNGFRIYRKLENKLIITDLDPAFHVRRKDTIDVPGEFFLHSTTDCTATSAYDVLVAQDRLLTFDRKANDIYYRHYDTLDFRNVRPINDTTVLLYIYANYHPADGFAGLQLYLLDLRTSAITRSYRSRVKGIGMAHMTVNWTVAAGKYIYAVTPLSGEITMFDQRLTVISKKRLPVPWTSYAANVQYERSTDSTIYQEHDRIMNILTTLGADSVSKNRRLILSDLYSKDFFSGVSQTVRKDYEFIEKALPFNDSTIIFTVSRPGYALKYRDIYFYNTHTSAIIRSIPKWSCAKKDSLTAFEDFFNVDVINDAHAAPLFIKDKVYFSTVYNIGLYKNGKADTLKKAMVKDINKNNYTWKLLEYSY